MRALLDGTVKEGADIVGIKWNVRLHMRTACNSRAHG